MKSKRGGPVAKDFFKQSAMQEKFEPFPMFSFIKFQRLTWSTPYLAITPYSSHLNIKTTSPLPHGGDVDTDDIEDFLSVGTK